VPNERTSDGDTLEKEWRWWVAKALGVWTMYALWIAYKFSSRGIVIDARAWSVALAVGFLTIVAQTSISLMIFRDPPKSLLRRLSALAGAIILASLTLVTWVMMPDWFETTP
jgi:hypothetical protein